MKVLLLTVQEPQVGIGLVELSDVAVYPNPTEGVVQLRLEGVTEVEVYDADGRLAACFVAGRTVDLGGRPAGTYLLRVRHPQGDGTCRVVKR